MEIQGFFHLQVWTTLSQQSLEWNCEDSATKSKALSSTHHLSQILGIMTKNALWHTAEKNLKYLATAIFVNFMSRWICKVTNKRRWVFLSTVLERGYKINYKCLIIIFKHSSWLNVLSTSANDSALQKLLLCFETLQIRLTPSATKTAANPHLQTNMWT